MTERTRPERTKPIPGKYRYCSRCRCMHPVMPEGFDIVEETVEQLSWDIAEVIDEEIFQELLSSEQARKDLADALDAEIFQEPPSDQAKKRR